VLVGDGGGLGAALAAVGLAVPDQITPADAGELRSFLDSRPAPPASGWSWLAP
jgi:hypothetical protein